MRTQTLIFDSAYHFGKRHQDSDLNWLVCADPAFHSITERGQGFILRPMEAGEVCTEAQVLSFLDICLVICFCSWWSQAQSGACVLWGHSFSSSSCIAAEERVEHGLLHTLLVLPAPCNHCPLTVGSVQMVAIARKCQAYDRLI